MSLNYRDTLPPHGTRRRYMRSCRCSPCRLAAQRYNDATDQGVRILLDATGARRRLQALACLGHSSRTLGARMGVAESILRRIRAGHTAKVGPGRWRQVAKVYEDLADQPMPGNRASGEARAHGWAPPSAWVDRDMDDPAAAPRGQRRADTGAASAAS